MFHNRNYSFQCCLSILIAAAKRRLGFLNKAGYDRFGKNKLFAPKIRWEALRTNLDNIKSQAQIYEKAYNDAKRTIELQESLRAVRMALPKAARIQVRTEKKRLKEARSIARSEKNIYVSVSFIFYIYILGAA